MEGILAPPHQASRIGPRLRVVRRAGAVAVVVALALLLRVRAAFTLPADYDEDDYLRAGQLYAQHIAAGDIEGIANERENYEHPPMTKLAFGAVLAVTRPPVSYAQPVTAYTGDKPADALIAAQAQPLRIFGAIIGALTAGAVAVVNPLAGLLIAINAWQIKYTAQAMLEALPCFFATLTLLLLRRSTRNGDAWWWAAAVLLGLTTAGKYLYGVAGLAAIIWMIWRERPYRHAIERSDNHRTGVQLNAPATTATRVEGPLLAFRRWSLVIVWGLVALLVFYAADPTLWHDPIGRLGDSILFNVGYTTGAQVQQTGLGWAYQLAWLLGGPWFNPNIAPLMLDGLFALFGLLAWRQVWCAERLVAIWFVVNLIFLFFWPTKWPQYILALTVPVSIATTYWLRTQIPALRARWRAWRGRPTIERRRERGALLWGLPALILFALIVVYPLLLQTALASTLFGIKNLRGGSSGLWLGFARGLIGLAPGSERAPGYIGTSGASWVLGWPDFLPILRFNIIWVLVSMALATALGLWLASLLQRRGLRGRTAWRLLFILPWAFPEFVGALIFSTLFDDLFGPINALTGARTDWLSDTAPLVDVTRLVKPSVDHLAIWRLTPLSETLNFVAGGLTTTKGFWVLVLLSVWVAFPFMMLIGIAALRAVPSEVYDAAHVDGAAGWTLWHTITWPLIRPTVLAGTLLRGILLFNAFHIPLMLVPDSDRSGTVTLAMVGYAVMRYNSDYTFAALINTAVLGVAIGMIWLFNRQTGVVEGVEHV